MIPDGIIFGLIDNGILAFTTLVGIDIDKYFKGTGVHGAIYGALDIELGPENKPSRILDLEKNEFIR